MGILKAISKPCSPSLSDLYRLKKIQVPSSLAGEGCEKVIRKSDRYRPTFQLCRYITRPAIANERLKLNDAGDVVLQLKSPYQDGTTHIVMSPLEFMQRLAALVPRPRLNLVRFLG